MKLRTNHFVVLLAAFCLLQSIASATVQVVITSPANGAQVHPGDTVYVSAQYTSYDNFLYDSYFEANNVQFGYKYWGYAMISMDSAGYNYTVPSSAVPGSTIAISVDCSQVTGSQIYGDMIYLSVIANDTTAPTYSGTAGIKTAVRAHLNASADLTWYQATDAVTSAANMKYDIYYDKVQANVFSAGIKQTVTGTTSGTITGLDPTATYYVGVRAVDQAGNREMNTNTLFLGFGPNAAKDWELYQ